MRRAILTIPAVLVVLLALAAVGLYWYDSSRSDRIVEGISVASVELGGMTANEARAALEDEIADPLERPVRVKAAGRRYALSARKAKLRTDVEGMVDTALERSREGNVLTRTWRDLTGDGLSAKLALKTSYSQGAVSALVDRVQADIDREPQNATVDPSPSGLSTTSGEDGREVDAGKLERQIESQIALPDGDRKFQASVETVEPAVSEDDLAAENPYYITIDRSSFTLRFFKELKLAESYEIAVGRSGFETPAGLYNVQNKAVDPAWHVPEWGGKLAGQTIPGGAPNNPLRERWLGIADGAGIHGTDDVASLGSAASHGCIRMRIPEVIELYDQVPVQTPVYIG
jgi:lipoprotein-anchoring transpeptidase ErfK/SrfK